MHMKTHHEERTKIMNMLVVYVLIVGYFIYNRQAYAFHPSIFLIFFLQNKKENFQSNHKLSDNRVNASTHLDHGNIVEHRPFGWRRRVFQIIIAKVWR